MQIISWVATVEDFDGSSVKPTGPNATLHLRYFQPQYHKQHILLHTSSDGKEVDPKAAALAHFLRNAYPDRAIQTQAIKLADPTDLSGLLLNCRKVLEQLTSGEDEIIIFVTPGTKEMHLAWALLHLENAFKTRLLRSYPEKIIERRKRQLRKSEAEAWFEELKIESSYQAHTLLISERAQRTPTKATAAPNGHYLSAILEPVYERARQVAAHSQIHALILGESGTGKENLAKHIHQNSAQANQRFVAINCASLTDSVLESRLFGYKKGAYTGADKDTPGYFETYTDGTLFLDEIGDISPFMQQSLLRVLQEGTFTRMGETTERKTNARIIAATHRNLRERCKAGTFRWDLYYRLSVAELHLPALAEWPLAERNGLLAHLAAQASQKLNVPLRELSKEAQKVLDAYTFPGNIRELENLLTRLHIFGKGKVHPAELPDYIRNAAGEHDYTLETASRRHAHNVLKGPANGNKTQAATLLGISRNTLDRYLD